MAHDMAMHGTGGGNGQDKTFSIDVTPQEDEAMRAIADAEFPVEVFSDICVCLQQIEVKSKGGLLLPGEEKKQRVARVLAAGPGRTYENGVTVPNPVKVGDWVVFGKYASGGEPLWFRQQEFVLFRAGDIVGKLRPGLISLD